MTSRAPTRSRERSTRPSASVALNSVPSASTSSESRLGGGREAAAQQNGGDQEEHASHDVPPYLSPPPAGRGISFRGDRSELDRDDLAVEADALVSADIEAGARGQLCR